MAGQGGPGSVRVDKWLWAVRVFKSRTAASTACDAGRVSVNGESAKPATKVVMGDEVRARARERTVVYRVTGLLERRVSAAAAAECYLDESPPPPPSAGRHGLDAGPGAVPGGARSRGEGRPTKRDRRDIVRLRGRDA